MKINFLFIFIFLSTGWAEEPTNNTNKRFSKMQYSLEISYIGDIEKTTYQGTFISRISSSLGISGERIIKDMARERNLDTKNMSVDELTLELDDYVQENYGKALNQRRLLYESLRFKMLWDYNTEKEIADFLKEQTSELNFNEKIYFIRELGQSAFLTHYNYSRLDDGNGDAISMMELIEAYRNNTEGGVCRDIATAQSRMLHYMGVEETYVVAFQIAGTGHSTTLVKDENSFKWIQINYGEKAAQLGIGYSLLRQDHSLPDHGLRFRVFDWKGSAIGQIPSEMGHIVREMMGENRYDIDPGLKILPMNGAQLKAKFDGGDFRAFGGTTLKGDIISGVASHYRTQDEENKYYIFHAGAAGMHLRADKGVYDTQQSALFGMGALTGKTNYLGTEKFKIRAESTLSGGFQFGLVQENNKKYNFQDEDNVLDGFAYLDFTARAKWKIEKLKTSGETVVTNRGTVMTRDVRANDSISYVNEFVSVRNSTATPLGNKPKLEIFTRTDYVHRKVGGTYSATVGLGSIEGRGEALITYENAAGDTPEFIPGAAQRIFTGGKVYLGKEKKTWIGGRFIRELESKINYWSAQIGHYFN